jgi:sorbitol/mannitol transport system permease protein
MPVAAAVLWKNVMLDPTFGLSAWVMRLLGLPAVYLIERFPMGSVIGVTVWQWTPFVMLILLAGLQSLPDSTVEAARIDGAGPVPMFRFIVLPHLQRFIEIALLLETIFILNVFGIIFVTTTGGPGIRTTNLPYQIYLEAFSRWNVGRASAYGLFAIILANIVVMLFLRVLRNQQTAEAS